VSDVEQAKTWADQVAALLVENAELKVLIAALKQTYVTCIAEREAERQALVGKSAEVPEAFPFNAIRHSR
jgi:hypothetical protein